MMNKIAPTTDPIDSIVFESRLGWILLAASSAGIGLLQFCGTEEPSRRLVDELLGVRFPQAPPERIDRSLLLNQVRDAVLRYLEAAVPIPAFPVDMRQATPFRRRIWQALQAIPFGETRTYLQLARSIEAPQASRAAGQACGSNPTAILVPCHRVIATGGGLGGYSGGLGIKQALLDLESRKA